MNAQFWRGRRIFLTGHTGFKGSWLSLWLQNLEAKLTGYALAPPTNPSLFEEANVANGMTSHIGDIRDMPALQAALTEARPEIVIHMAAQPLVRYSYQNPLETYAVNVMGTVNLFEAIRSTSSVKAVVNVTTDKCYENQEWVWGYREHDPMGGHDPYSSSKACSELVTAAYRNSFFNATGVSLASARAGNVIGGGDWATDRLIPDIIAAFEQGMPVAIRNPHAIRPWQHVLEPLCGYLTLAEHLYNQGQHYAEGWNFGPYGKDAKPVSWITEQLACLWGQNVHWKVDEGNHPHEAHYLKLDVSKAGSRLGWYPQWTLEMTLSKIVEWQLAYLAKKNMRSFTLNQITQYTESRGVKASC